MSKIKTIGLATLSLVTLASGVFCLQKPFALVATDGEDITSSIAVETSSEVSSSITPDETSSTTEASTSSSENKYQEEYEYYKNLIDTYLVPIFGSVSLTSVLAAIVAIVTSIIKHKGDKNVIASLDAKTTAYEKILDQSIEVVKASKDLMDSVNAKSKLDEAELKALTTKCDTLLMSIATETKQVEKVQEIQSVVEQLNTILGKMASNTKELVASGVAEDIDKLLKETKELK